MPQMPRYDPFQVLASDDLNDMSAEIERVAVGLFSGLDATARPGFRVDLTSNYSLPSLEFDPLPWGEASLDPYDMWSAVDPEIVTITVPGFWILHGQIRYPASSGGYRFNHLEVNLELVGTGGPGNIGSGNTLSANALVARNDGYGNVVPNTYVGRLEQGDVIRNHAYQESGANLNVLSGSNGTYLSGIWLGP